jgi:hypothetical protein
MARRAGNTGMAIVTARRGRDGVGWAGWQASGPGRHGRGGDASLPSRWTTCAGMRWRAACSRRPRCRAPSRLGFVQADPIRAPARAQDLTLRHRVRDYRAGDLERRYPRLAVEEDFFVNYGFLPRATQQLMHPRTPRTRLAEGALGAGAGGAGVRARARRGAPARGRRAVRARQDHATGSAASSNASTQLLDGMHYRGLLRVARREGGTRLYAGARGPGARADPTRARPLVDVVLAKYAPLPERSLGGAGEPPGAGRAAMARRTARRAARCWGAPAAGEVDGLRWYWPAGENPASRRHRIDEQRAPARALRPGGVGPPPLRALLGLGLPLRGLHAGAAARARLLRAAAAVARPGRSAGATWGGRRPLRCQQRLRHLGEALAALARGDPGRPVRSSAAKRRRLATPTLCGKRRTSTWSLVLSPT